MLIQQLKPLDRQIILSYLEDLDHGRPRKGRRSSIRSSSVTSSCE